MNNFRQKTAFFTVVYPAVKPFLPDFFASLQQQTNPEFDVIVFNDGITDSYFTHDGLNIIVVDCCDSPAAIRQQGLEYLIANDYVNVVFGDSDDYFAPERVGNSLDLLQQFDIVINDVSLVDQDGRLLFGNYFSQRIVHLDRIYRDFISDRNIFGLSNTAVRLSCMKKVDCPEELVAADWYMFSLALANGARAIFSSAGTTFYRQHGSNIAGFQKMTPARALAGVNCKSLHYAAMAQIDKTYSHKATAFKQLYSALSSDEVFLQKYYDYLAERGTSNPFWWEDILLPEEMR